MNNRFYPFVNTPLPYAYNALEPFIDEKTMELHHDRHLQTYIDNLNAILENNPGLQGLPLDQLIYYSGRLPAGLRTEVRNNAGGVYNHRFFFEGMTPGAAGTPSGTLADTIEEKWESFDAFREEFKKAALSVFGSGYAWLVYGDGKPEIMTTPNQNSPIGEGLCPILAIDVWEHAYYLKHYNDRSAYIDDWFDVVNWPVAERNYLACIGLF
ncbi:MAG: superoxide dismutase [Clostridiales bacterium]|nr:superoxide dismutase [Clostridiales bacterium]